MDYRVYKTRFAEKTVEFIKATLVSAGICYVFYHSAVICIIAILPGLIYPVVRKRQKIKQKRKELTIQFKDLLYSLSSSVSAGNPLETAFSESLKDLSIIYGNPETQIIKEVRTIVNRIRMNEPIECVLTELAERTGIDDIKSLSDTISVCKRAGSNIPDILRNTVSLISDKIEISQEIDVLLAERALEYKLLTVLPVFLVAVLTLAAGDFMEPLFQTIQGRIITSFSLLLFTAAFFISRKLMDIRI